MSKKLDFMKSYKEYYTAKQNPIVHTFGSIPYLSIEGVGEPAGVAFTEAVEALYPLAYGIKKICKLMEQDFGVPKLEGLWWVNSKKLVSEVPRSEWCWDLLIRMPEFVTTEMFKNAKEEVFKKKGIELLDKINYKNIEENQVVQIMHIGPYSTETKTIKIMDDFIKENQFAKTLRHHEIYLSDPRKTAPEKMKTILRQPIIKS